MNILCLRTLLIPRIRTLLKLVKEIGGLITGYQGLLQKSITEKVLGAMRTEAEPWRAGNEAAVCLSLRLGPVALYDHTKWQRQFCKVFWQPRAHHSLTDFISLNLKSQKRGTSGQHGGIGRYTLPPCTIKRRTTTNLKTKNNQKLPENRTVCKSDNQGVKEETFIQTARRGGDR